jgi:hypothetical protein
MVYAADATALVPYPAAVAMAFTVSETETVSALE